MKELEGMIVGSNTIIDGKSVPWGYKLVLIYDGYENDETREYGSVSVHSDEIDLSDYETDEVSVKGVFDSDKDSFCVFDIEEV